MGGYHSDGHTLNPLERSLRHSSACPTPLYSYFYILCFYVFAYLFSNFASLSPTLISSFPCASHVSAQRRFLAPSAAHGSRPTIPLPPPSPSVCSTNYSSQIHTTTIFTTQYSYFLNTSTSVFPFPSPLHSPKKHKQINKHLPHWDPNTRKHN